MLLLFIGKLQCFIVLTVANMIKLVEDQDIENYDFQAHYQQLMNINAEQPDIDPNDNHMLNKLDSLRFSKWHLFVALALGLIWIFDGYQVTLISLYRHQIELETSEKVFKTLVSAYQVGCMVGSLVFGVFAFIVGRRKIFLITLVLYFFGVMFSGIKTNPFLLILARFVTGLSVGGQFTAIFTAVDQFMPPSYRGRVNIGIDGTWHLGGTLASLLTLLINQQHWRLMFLVGWLGILALILMRRNMPQSPRWLLLKGRHQQANTTIQAIVEAVHLDRFILKYVPIQSNSNLGGTRNQHFCGYIRQIIGLIYEGVTKYTRKFIVSFTLIFTQALFFNLIYYQYPDILSKKYNLNQSQISFYMLPLSFVSFISTLFVGPFFDKIGRRKLLLCTYGLSGILLLIDYSIDSLLWREITVCFLFIFASPAGSSANLIASEIFPTSSRTIMLFVMFIVSMLGGSVGVWFDNYIVASLMMSGAGIVAFIFCPDSENKTLQQIQKL